MSLSVRCLVIVTGRNLTVGDLKPGSTYTFFLSAGNAVGFGKPVKFRVRTPRRMHFKEQAGALRHDALLRLKPMA